jgi:hypothetical protein
MFVPSSICCCSYDIARHMVRWRRHQQLYLPECPNRFLVLVCPPVGVNCFFFMLCGCSETVLSWSGRMSRKDWEDKIE